MDTFRGKIKGAAYGDGTRIGTVESGIESALQSWSGSIITKMNYDEFGQLIIDVEVSPTCNTWGTPIFKGTIQEFMIKLMS